MRTLLLGLVLRLCASKWEHTQESRRCERVFQLAAESRSHKGGVLMEEFRDPQALLDHQNCQWLSFQRHQAARSLMIP